MSSVRRVSSVKGLPFYVIGGESVREVDMAAIIEDEPLAELIARLGPGEVLYPVDQTSHPELEPGTVKLTRLT